MTTRRLLGATALLCVILSVTIGGRAYAEGEDIAFSSQLDELQQQVDELREVQRGENGLHWYWNDGMRLNNADETFKLRWGGRIHNDYSFYVQDDELTASLGGAEMSDGTEFRRAEFYCEGLIHDSVGYKIELEFAGGLAFEDVFISLLDLPFGTLRVGFDEEELSMDELTSNKYITFMERSLTTVFKPGHSTGVSLRKTLFDRRFRWTIGVFKDTGKFGESNPLSGKDFSTTGRVSFLPIYRDGGRQLLHIGMAGTYRRPRGDAVDYKMRPESHMAMNMAGTGPITTERLLLTDFEIAFVRGPLHVQTEYVMASIDRPTGSDARLWGYYVHAGYFLTGEHKPYDQGDGVFGRLKPTNNFGGGEGFLGGGAWEVAARYSRIDFIDADIAGGKLDSFTLGLNWYLNPNTRIMFNQVYSKGYERFPGTLCTTQMRIQIDF